jgi:hypothetical protein
MRTPSTSDWRRNLRGGDEVTWNDPDDGLCSRQGVINLIKYTGQNTATITWEDGDVTEVFLSELS